MRVELTGSVMMYFTGQTSISDGSTIKTCLDVYITLFFGPWSLVLFPGRSALCFFFSVLLWAAFCGVRRAKNERAQPTHPRPKPDARTRLRKLVFDGVA